MTQIHTETQRDGLTIRYFETTDEDYEEELGGQTPDTITHRPIKIFKRDCFAVGFSWAHPSGTTLSGNFDKPIRILSQSNLEDGDPETEHYNATVFSAICGKLGNISGLEDLEVDFEGRE